MNDWWLQGGKQTEKHILVLLRFQRCSRCNQTAYHTLLQIIQGTKYCKNWSLAQGSSFLKSVRLAVWIVGVQFHLQASSTTLLSRLNIALLRSTQWNSWNKSVDHPNSMIPICHKNSTVLQDSAMGAQDHQM
jgi:hypothetical protein